MVLLGRMGLENFLLEPAGIGAFLLSSFSLLNLHRSGHCSFFTLTGIFQSRKACTRLLASFFVRKENECVLIVLKH